MEIANEALLRIRAEYIEMPDLKLTPAQARRLWNLPQEVCDAALATLVRTGFLSRTHDGLFLRRGLGRGRAAIRRAGVAAEPEVATAATEGAVQHRADEPVAPPAEL